MKPAFRHLCTAAWALVAAGCGGSDDGPPISTLPAGMTQHSVTTYSATAPGAGTSAATQDLLTGGLGKTGLGSRRQRPPMRTR